MQKKIKKGLAKFKVMVYNTLCQQGDGLSPNGKALDSDSSICRFESCQPSMRHLIRDDKMSFFFI